MCYLVNRFKKSIKRPNRSKRSKKKLKVLKSKKAIHQLANFYHPLAFHAEKNKQCFLPVTGASMSIIVFSDLRRAAPSLMILSAAFSSSRPSRMKCCLRTSGLGLLVRESNTSAIVILFAGGNGTAERNNELKSIS